MKRLLCLLVAAAMTASLNAAPVNRTEALRTASTFMKLMQEEQSLPVESIREVELQRSWQLDRLFIFTGDHCFVILSGDDRALPILAYSLDGPFDTEDLPENLLSWLQGYNQEIQYLVEHQVEAPEAVQTAWLTLAQGKLQQPLNRSEVQPLMSSKWGQGYPFNYSCPDECVTGCVATAMSQIMRYWEYPNKGTGSHSYYHTTYGTLSANFGNTTYDWDHMTSSPTSSCSLLEKQALGTLCYQAGVAVDMDYGPDASAASSYDAPDALKQYFGYSSEAMMVEKSDYTDAGWKNLLKGELDLSRPLYYSGNNATSNGGHAFVCDGYDVRDYFHFNWGWKGNHNGFYMMGALNPDEETDLNYINKVIIGLHPVSYALAAPTNLSAVVQGHDVRLSWTASSGAASYNVYRNGDLLASGVTGTTFVDENPGYGSYTYYVKALKSNGDRSPRSTAVAAQLVYSIPAPTEVTGQFHHDNASLTLSWNMSVLQEDKLHYGMGPYAASGYGYPNPYPTYWAHRYPVSMLVPYAGMKITSVEVYLRATGNYTLYLYAGSASGPDELLFQQPFSCVATGENLLEFANPVALDYEHDLWVVFYAPTTIQYPAAYCNYNGSGLANASYISYNGSTWNSHAENQISWMIEVYLEAPEYTYKISKNGTVIADYVTGLEYEDGQLTSGTTTYQVQAVCEGETSGFSDACSISLVEITTSVNNPAGGAVDNGGLYQEGENVNLHAYPNTTAGYVFKEWQEGGVSVNTNPTYSFVATVDRDLVACFANNHGVDDLQASLVLYPNPVKSSLRIEGLELLSVKVYSLDGRLLMAPSCESTFSMTLDMNDLKAGQYLLELTTPEGVVRKMVVKD